jgi:hypothetical protein
LKSGDDKEQYEDQHHHQPGARVSSTEPHPHHDCDKPDKPCRRHLRETPVYRIKIKRFSAETMNAQSSGAASMDHHLSSPETRLLRADYG